MGPTKQKAARLVVDLASTAGASEFIRVDNAHVSGVSVITGGHGLRRFLSDLSGDPKGAVSIPTTLNSAGCDHEKMDEMGIDYPDFLEQQFEIVQAYSDLGIEATLSCTPYDRGIESTEGIGSWAESNAVCFSNSYTSLVTNRESGLSALATALTGWAPKWGLHIETNRSPNILVDGITPDAPLVDEFQGNLNFTDEDLRGRYRELSPKGKVDLVVIGCPQASVGEARETAAAVRAKMELGEAIPNHRLWLFMSSHNYDLISLDGTLDILEEAGALVLRDTCPEVTPYNRSKYNHLLTNSLKAEHYLTSGLNRIPTSVAPIMECVSHAFDDSLIDAPRPELVGQHAPAMHTAKTHQESPFSTTGKGIPSQSEWEVSGRALVTDVPITYLGYVNRDTGVIEEPGHPLDGIPIRDTVLIYPKGSGSTVAPFVLMGLIYTGFGPKAILNRDVCPLTLPAASLLGVPYAHGFEEDPTLAVNTGDVVSLGLSSGIVSLKVESRHTEV